MGTLLAKTLAYLIPLGLCLLLISVMRREGLIGTIATILLILLAFVPIINILLLFILTRNLDYR